MMCGHNVLDIEYHRGGATPSPIRLTSTVTVSGEFAVSEISWSWSWTGLLLVAALGWASFYENLSTVKMADAGDCVFEWCATPAAVVYRGYRIRSGPGLFYGSESSILRC